MSRHPFDLLMELKTDEIRLDCAALHLARDVYPGLNVQRYLDALDTMAQQVAELRPGLAANLRYEAMHEVLVECHNLTGNPADFFDPENSYLNRVLDAGLGIPISLSVVWIEVARRLKWPVSGVALPGNFLVRFDDPERFVLANPFHDGRSLSIDECQLLVKERFEGKLAFTTDYLRPVNNRNILLRMLGNLKNIYLAYNDLARVASVLQRMVAIQPRSSQHLLELAAVETRRGNLARACGYLELCTRRAPQSRNAEHARHNLKQLQAAILALN